MCNKTVDTYLSAIQFVPEWSKTQKISDKAIGTRSFVLRVFLFVGRSSFVFGCVTN